jgi:L-lactate dehydrogenase complex protein LldG
VSAEPSGRHAMLARIRAANGRAAAPDAAAVAAAYADIPRDYLRAHHGPDSDELLELFVARLRAYRATAARVASADVPAELARVLAARTAAVVGPIVVPDGLPDAWLAGCGELDLLRESSDASPHALPSNAMPSNAPLPKAVLSSAVLSSAVLDAASGVVTGCATAIAETGTIILDHGPAQGRRALTLLPDFHLCLVRADQLAADLPDALSRLDPRRPHTLISGPSATSDIEFVRVEGVHGPRTLHVLIIEEP